MNNKKVKNTAKNPRFEWLFGGNPNAIEAQEQQGQKELLESSQLPIKVNSAIKMVFITAGISIILYAIYLITLYFFNHK